MSSPTAAQKRTFAKIYANGCMACLQDEEGLFTPCSIHHAREYGYRNHDMVYGLCPPHHQIDHAVPGVLNRHKNPIEFAKLYGSDSELVAKCMEMIGE